ncbi:MAG TPA: hypothetical protein VF441_03545 [Acidimicrobiia bacterium]
MTLTPDELFDALGVALRPPPVEPTPAELAALHRMIDERCVDRTTARVPATRSWMRPFVVVAAAAGIVVGSGAAAFAVGAPVPRPIRAVAHDVGLPVDSPELTDAKGAASDLRIVLAINDPATIKRVRARLNHKLAEVPGDERGQIERDTKALLAQADQQLRTAEATQPATGDGSPKGGGAAAGRSKSGDATSGSGGAGSSGALAGGSATGVSGSGPGAASPPGLTLPGQPSGPAGSVVPPAPPRPAPAPAPSVPPVVAPPVVAPPVVATPVVATPAAPAPVTIATVATAADVSAPVVSAPVVAASPPVTSDLAA